MVPGPDIASMLFVCLFFVVVVACLSNPISKDSVVTSAP